VSANLYGSCNFDQLYNNIAPIITSIEGASTLGARVLGAAPIEAPKQLQNFLSA
jgi:hypothetical protein